MTRDPRYSGSSPPCTSEFSDKSLLIYILPELDQSALYNSINQSLTIFGHENQTSRLVSVSTYSCPSDLGADQLQDGDPARFALTGLATRSAYPVTLTNYAGMYGSLLVDAIPRPEFDCRVPWERINQINGCFNDCSPLRMKSIDFKNRTILMAERTLAPLNDLRDKDGSLRNRYGWMISGDLGDTLVTGFYPPNAYRKIAVTSNNVRALTCSASSLHPQGLNVLKADGSVSFIRDSISSWPHDPQGQPLGANQTLRGVWIDLPPHALWQTQSRLDGYFDGCIPEAY